MNASIYRIYLDVHTAHSGLSLDVKKADTGRKICITLTDGGFPYQISEECYAVFTATKPDGAKIFKRCDINGNTIIYQMTPQTTAVVGAVECEIRLYGADDNLITSPGFSIVVNETAYTEGDQVQSESEVDALTHLISDATTVITDGEHVISKGEEVNAKSEALIQDVEAKRATLDQQIADTAASAGAANKSALRAESAASSASSSASLATTKAYAANVSADSAKASEEAAKASASTAVNMANAALASQQVAVASAEEARRHAEQVKGTVEDALTEAKVSGKFDGRDGATYIPKMRSDGYLEWSNNMGFPNPVPAKVKGDPGKSAYAYAKDGGYTGTEEEFAEMLANGPGSSQNVNLTGYATEEWVQEGFQPKGEYLTEVPKGYATETFVTAKIAEAQLNGSDVDMSGYATKDELPTKTSQLQNDSGFLTDAPVDSVNGKTGAVKLTAEDVGARSENWMPTAQEVGALPSTYTPPNQTADQVGADAKGTAAGLVNGHNTDSGAHNDLRMLIQGLTTRLNALANSTDEDLDQMAELVGYIKSNKSLIDGITTSKVNVADIVNDLTTNAENKPLSAAQGVAMKALIDAIAVPTKLSQLANDKGFITSYTETDPTVPAWAKQSKKPTYTAAEVGALPNTTVIPTVPTKVSAFTNDAGYLTEHQDISGKLDSAKLPEAVAMALDHARIGSVYAPAPQAPAKTVQVVASIDEMTDPAQRYALNGYIYECVVTETTKGYTNRLTAAGWQNNTRINSSGEVKDASGITIATSGLIACVPGDRLRIKSVQKSGDYAVYIASYNASGTKTGLYKISDAAAIDYVEIDKVLDSATFGAFTAIRFCSRTIDSSTIVTINEAIEESVETVYNWIDTGEEYTPGDFDAETCAAQNIYDYLDILCAKYPGYITKETMGKDESGSLDCNRYILCKHYYTAWQKNNYPKMYGWVNGSTVIYSTSISPRIGDPLYSTKYIGTAKGTVAAISNANQTRTVGGVVYTRDKTKDVEPTLVFVSVVDNAAGTGEVYDETKKAIATVSAISATAMSDTKGNSYTRYPMGDRDKDMHRPTVVVIGANEHGPQGDPREPAIICARMAKDLCECRRADNWMLHHLKNNCMVVLVPVINPYGFTNGQGTGAQDGYYNANGVNINRNYDCPGWGLETNAGPAGEYGGSENETQYFMNTISEPNSAVAISIHCLGYTSGANDGLCHYQGNGFNAEKLALIAETMVANYNLRFTSYSDAPLATTAKSPTYITQAGAVGGIIEMQAREGKMGEEGAALHTARIMEANYTMLLQCIQMWLTDYAETEQ